MEDPYLPAPMATEPCKPMTPSLLFQKLSELKLERELLTRHGEEMNLLSVAKESPTPLAEPTTNMKTNDSSDLAILDPFYAGSDDGDRTLVGEDELGVALPISYDKPLLPPSVLKEDGYSDSHDEEEDSTFSVLPNSLPPVPSPDAPIAEHVRWHVMRVVQGAMDTLTLDLPQAFEESRLGGAAFHLVRYPTNVVADSIVVRALRSRLEAVIQGQLIRHVQNQYTYARYAVISTVERDINDVYDQADLLRDDVQVIGAHIDSLQARLEALVTQKVNLISEMMTRYINEVIPCEFDRLLRRFILAEGSLMRPIYDRVHNHLLPLVAAIVTTLVTTIQQHADWVNTTVVRKIGDDFKGIRQQFAL